MVRVHLIKWYMDTMPGVEVSVKKVSLTSAVLMARFPGKDLAITLDWEYIDGEIQVKDPRVSKGKPRLKGQRQSGPEGPSSE